MQTLRMVAAASLDAMPSCAELHRAAPPPRQLTANLSAAAVQRTQADASRRTVHSADDLDSAAASREENAVTVWATARLPGQPVGVLIIHNKTVKKEACAAKSQAHL